MGKVIAVCTSATHTLQKPNQGEAKLIQGLGFESDAHQGVTVKHRSRVKKDPTVANLRQVHLIHAELHDELNAKGFSIAPGEMGENLTTRGIDLLNLPKDSILHIGNEAKVQLTGLRNPCYQLDGIQKGLM
ncbi:MAG: MOSC domain-containing protein, partial [Flavobacteriales bacterium]